MSNTRIYLVAHGSIAHLVRAPNQAQAIRHVSKGVFTCAVATQDDLVEYLASGADIEDASHSEVDSPSTLKE